MVRQSIRKLALAGTICAAMGVVAAGVAAQQKPGVAPSELVVTPCDGGTPMKISGVKPGERLAPEQAQAVADQLMASWLGRQPDDVAAAWVAERDAALAAAPQNAGPVTAAGSAQQHVEFTARDYAVWESEVAREIAYGNALFHDDKGLGSPEGVACAMCHPNASNTHPETYPKFQTQLKKTALLRDMINWCIENPLRGPKLAADDPKMRALEAYILAQRKGVPLEFGKH